MTRRAAFHQHGFLRSHFLTGLVFWLFWTFSLSAAPNGVPTRSGALQAFALSSANQPPRIDPILLQRISENTTLVLTNVTIFDETPATLQPKGLSSNIHLVRDQDIVFTRLSSQTWSLSATPAANRFGTTTITVEVIDSLLLRSSKSFPLTVSPASITNFPAIRLVTSKTNETFLVGADIVLEADALDLDGRITKVEFFYGSTNKLGETTISPYQFTWRVPAPGSYDVWAKATDDQGQTNGTGNVTIKVISTFPQPTRVSMNEGDAADIIVFGGNPDHPTTLDYTTANAAPQTALGDLDYRAITGRLTWPTGSSTATLRLQTLADSVFDPNEAFVVKFSNPSTGLPAVYPEIVVTIVETNPPPVIFLKEFDKSIAEGNGGVTQLTSLFFTLGISMPYDRPIPVDFVITNGTATAARDYVWLGGFDTVSFLPGTTETTIRVRVIGDRLDEPDEETLFIKLIGTDPPFIIDETKSQVKATILDDDDPPRISFREAVFLNEGPAGVQTNAVFTVVLSEASGKAVTAQYVTTNGTATAGEDYLPVTTGTIRIEPEQPSANITVVVNGDNVSELDETFSLLLTSPANAVFAPGQTQIQAQATILNDDVLPEISISGGATLLEGNTGTASTNILVSLSITNSQPVRVDFVVTNEIAAAELGFAFITNTLTFSPGQLTKPIPILIKGDPLDEPDQTFLIKLSNPSNAIILTNLSQSIITIVDDDSPPSISIQNATVLEGNVGPTNAVFAVNLSAPSGQIVQVEFGTTDETAQAGLDYIAVSTNLTFNLGETSKLINVQVNGDTLMEADETFLIRLSNPQNANLITATPAVGTIRDDELLPQLSINDITVREGDSDSTNAVFTVTLSAPSTLIVTVDFSATNGTALAEIDFLPTTNRLTYSPGEITKTIEVTVKGDRLDELDETILIDLFNPTNAVLAASSRGRGTIQDDDLPPTITVEKASVREGNAELASAVFFLTLSAASGQIVTVDYATTNGTAQAESDYVPASGTVTFKPGATAETGETIRAIIIQVKGDIDIEPNETFLIHLSNPINALVPVNQAEGTIIDDEERPALLVDDVSVTEGDSGSVNARFTVRLSQATTQRVSVDLMTTNGTATAGLDYISFSTNIVFEANQTTNIVNIQVLGDLLKEANESFSVLLSNPTGAVIEDPEVVATIDDDDPVPSVTATALAIPEGNTNSVNVVIPVTLSGPSSQTISVDVTTSDGTATSGRDYLASTNKLVFAPNEIAKEIVVVVNGDFLDELDETILLKFSNVTNALIPDQPVPLTIVDDDIVPTISIRDALPVVEGAPGATTGAIFELVLSQASEQEVTARLETTNGIALASVDFQGVTNGIVRLAPRQTSAQFTVVVTGDSVHETNETFFVNLVGSENALIDKDQSLGKATILDDDPLPTIVVKDVRIIEGSGEFSLEVPVALSGPSSQPINVDFITVDGSAISGRDYFAREGRLSFAPGETVRPVVVFINSDTLSEDNESFTVLISQQRGEAVVVSRLTVVIEDDNDPQPVIKVTNASGTEGNLGTPGTVVFEVSLSEPSGRTVTVNVATADDTAKAGADYDPIPPATLFFLPGQSLVKQISVTLKADSLPEPQETFLLVLTNAVNALLPDNQAIGDITDDDAPVGIFITDAAVTELDIGSTNAIFVVSLSAPSDKEVTVQYTTVDNTAEDKTDYRPSSGVITFPPGSAGAQVILVPVNGDLLNEGPERFFVNLSNPSSNAEIFDPQAVATITDNDPVPKISILDGNGTEGSLVKFSVRLSAPSGRPITVQFTTTNGTAASGSDYASSSGSVTFLPGQTEQTISVLSLDDGAYEISEDFFIQLTEPVNAELVRGRAVGTIIDNDALPTISINSVTVKEGDSGTTDAIFTVTLSTLSSEAVSVNFATIPGSAAAPSDFVSRSGTLTFPAGTTNQTITITVNGDNIDEPAESFFVDLSDPINATLGTKRGVGDIFDDDVEPTLSVTDGAAPLEGTTDTNRITFTVRLSAPSSQVVTANFATADGTAVAGTDYVAVSGTLTFAPGTMTNSIVVLVIPDTLDENNETFEVRITSPTNAGLGDGVGLGTIIDDDVPPTLTISDAVVTEGNSGRTDAVFTVQLSIASSQIVGVDFRTSDGTASVGLDFSAASGTLTFPAGTVTQTLSVPVVGDTLFEASETFFVSLTNAVNASIADAVGLGTILNDDAAANQPPTVRITSPANGSAFTAPVELPIAVEARDSDGQVQRVDFFIGSILLGSRAAPPFTLTWTNDAAGAYSLTAVAVDDKGATTTSTPVNILTSRRIIASDVAIVQNVSNPEITLLQDYLLELGVSSQIFDQEGLTFDVLKDHKLIIWDDLGSIAGGLTDKDVEIFRQAFSHEIALFFIGGALADSARNLNGLQPLQWTDLIHLTTSGSAVGNGTVILDQGSNHPVINGHFGVIRSFGYSTNLNSVMQPTRGAFVLGRSGTADVLVAFEDEISGLQTRTLSQSFQVAGAFDASSLAERKRLFKNSASWLLRKSFQSLTDLSIELTGPSEPATVGQQLTYSAIIGHQGEIAGTGVTVTIPLPANLKFLGGNFIQGTVSEAEGAIIYHLGSMESGQQTLFSFTVTPAAPGKILVQANVSGNEADPGLLNNSASVETLVFGDLPEAPKLILVRLENQNLQLLVTGPPQTIYRLQVSTDLVNWLTLTNVTASQPPLTLDGPGATKLSERFFRIVP